MDRDPLLVGSARMEWPGLLLLWLVGLDIVPLINRAYRPTDNAIVERNHWSWELHVLDEQTDPNWPPFNKQRTWTTPTAANGSPHTILVVKADRLLKCSLSSLHSGASIRQNSRSSFLTSTGSITISPTGSGIGSISVTGHLKLDGLPVDVSRFGGRGEPYRIEQWVDGKLMNSVGNFQAGEEEFRVFPYADNYTPWGCPPA